MPEYPVRRGILKKMTLSPEACAVLEALAHGPHKQGEMLSRLLCEERVRVEERARCQATRDPQPAP